MKFDDEMKYKDDMKYDDDFEKEYGIDGKPKEDLSVKFDPPYQDKY